MAKGKKTGGRQPGSKNKATASVKAALFDAFERVAVGGKKGGVDSLIQWASENPTEFYKLWGRLAPTEITGKDGEPIKVDQVWQIGERTVRF